MCLRTGNRCSQLTPRVGRSSARQQHGTWWQPWHCVRSALSAVGIDPHEREFRPTYGWRRSGHAWPACSCRGTTRGSGVISRDRSGTGGLGPHDAMKTAGAHRPPVFIEGVLVCPGIHAPCHPACRVSDVGGVALRYPPVWPCGEGRGYECSQVTRRVCGDQCNPGG